MSESTRKKIIFGLLVVAIIWGYNNLRPTPKNAPSRHKPAATAEPNAGVDPVARPVAATPKLVNIEKKTQEPWGKDPFRVRGTTQHTQPPQKKEKWQLSGILYNSESPVAIINDKPVRAGDLINSAKVLRIDRKSVILEHNGSKMTLTVTKG